VPRVPLIAGNWKMNTTLEEARALAAGIVGEVASVQGVEVMVAPPFVSLAAVSEVLRGSRVALGAQNMYHEEKGSFTGEVSPPMLRGLCTYVILGHSERRTVFHEGDAEIAKKVDAALAHGLAPILCVGENKVQRDDGEAEAVVAGQVREALWSASFDLSLVIAYEPVWAIGTGAAATAETAEEMSALIREELAKRYSAARAEELRILYGGSVTPHNIEEFVSQPDVDGALVGGASLRAADFAGIVRAASRVLEDRR